ncbi:MAG: hypothetical protein PWQ16_413 [bacterium]|nr:hypothetical protein [bacterium]
MDRLKLYRNLLIISIVGLVTLMLFMHYSATREVRNLFLQEGYERLLSASHLVRTVLEENISKIRLLGRELERNPRLADIRSLLKSFYEESEGSVLAVQWIDRNGVLKEGFPPEHTPYGYSFRESKSSWAFFEKVLNSKDALFSNSITLSEGDLGLTLAYPVKDEEGNFLGAVAFIISYSKNIGSRLFRVKNFLIIDAQDGSIVFSPERPFIVGKKFKEVFGVELPSTERYSYIPVNLEERKGFVLFDKFSLLSKSWYTAFVSFDPFYTLFGFVPGIGIYAVLTFLFIIATVAFMLLLFKELRVQKRKLKKDRDFTGRALGSIGMPLLIMDSTGKVSFANDFAKDLFGEGIEGKQCPFLLRYPYPCVLHEKLEKDGEVTQELSFDENKVFEISCFSIKGEGGGLEGILSLARDVTETRKSEYRLWDLARRLERKIWEEHILFELSKVVVVHRDRGSFVTEVMDLIYAYFPVTLAFIAFLDDRWRALKVEKVRGGRKEVKDVLILEKGLSRVVDMGEVLYIPDTRGFFSIGKNFGVDTLSELVLPLIARKSTFGVLFLASDKVNAFSEEDRGILRTIADMIAIGIDNISLYEKLNSLATTDDLTGLYNRRFFYKRLSEEVARAKRQKADLFLMLIDLDNFKRYNDTFGHIAGDKLLKSFGKVLEDTIRKGVDYAFRYGGDEFAVILTSLPEEGALKVADRISREFERYEFEIVGLSFGIAQYEEGMTEEAIIAAADIALYEAKRRGGRIAVLYRELAGSTSSPSETSTDSSYPSTAT